MAMSPACFVPSRGVRALGAGAASVVVSRRHGRLGRVCGALSRRVGGLQRVVGLDADGGKAGVGDVQQDRPALAVVTPDAVQRRVGLHHAVGGALGDQPAGGERADHLGGGATAQRPGQRQHVTVVALGRHIHANDVRVLQLRQLTVIFTYRPPTRS